MWTLFRIALRNVVRNRRRTLITLAALLLGVGVLVTIRGLLNGLQRAMITSAVESTTGALQVHRKGYLKNVLSSPLTLDLPADDAFLARIRAVPGVKAAAPRIQFAGSVSTGDVTLFLAAQALDPVRELEVCPARSRMFTRGGALADGDGILLAKELHASVGAVAGSEGVLLAPDRDGALNGEAVHFAGTLESTFGGEKKVGVVPLGVAQRLLRMEGRATEIAVAVTSLDDLDAVAGRLREALGPDYEVHTWAEITWFIRQAMERQNFVLSFIGVVFMVLMLLGVANTMLMSVLERTREIGTMMAVGVTRGRLVGLFLFEALALGAAGGVVGGAAGELFSRYLYARGGVEFSPPGASVPFVVLPYVTPQYLAFVVALAAAGAVVFALYPALRASRLRPVEALAGQ